MNFKDFKDFKKDVESVLKYFEANTPNYVDCGTDVDKFINICLQFK